MSLAGGGVLHLTGNTVFDKEKLDALTFSKEKVTNDKFGR